METTTLTLSFSTSSSFHNAGKAFHRPVGDPDGIADAIVDLDLTLFHAQRRHFLFGQWNRFGRRADKAGTAAGITDNVPRFVGHDHFDQYIAGEYLRSTSRFLLSLISVTVSVGTFTS